MELVFASNVAQNLLILATISIRLDWLSSNLKGNAIFVENSAIDYIFAKNAIFTSAKIV